MPQALVRAGQPDEAIKYIEKGARLDPKSPNRWVRDFFLSVAHMQLQQYDEAEAAARRANLGTVSTRFTWDLVAIVLVAQGNLEEAKVTMARARAIEPDYTLVNLEQFYLRFFPGEQQAVQVMAWARQAWGDE